MYTRTHFAIVAASLLMLAGCSNDRAAARTPEVQEPAPTATAAPAAPTPAWPLLDRCARSTEEFGLQFKCDDFIAVVARLTSDDGLTDAVLQKVESDIIAGLAQSMKGEIRRRQTSASSRTGKVPVSGYDFFVDDVQRSSGAVVAVANGPAEALTITCVATNDLEGALCPAVITEVLTLGLPGQ